MTWQQKKWHLIGSNVTCANEIVLSWGTTQKNMKSDIRGTIKLNFLKWGLKSYQNEYRRTKIAFKPFTF